MKKTIATFALASIMTLGTTFAHGGIIVAGRPDNSGLNTNLNTCGKRADKTEGIIVAGLVGIIVAGFTGIIVAGAPDKTDPRCHEQVLDTEGIIVAG
jgi:hypothetical protein